MLVKYVGRRTIYSIRFGRVPYNFSEENNFTLDIKEKQVVNYIFGLANKNEFEVFEVIEKEESKEEPKEESKEVSKVKKAKKTGGKNGKRSKHK